MRGHVTASASVAIVAAALSGCGPARATVAPPRDPPARVLSVGLERIGLRASAYVELHAWLAAAGRGATAPPSGQENAAVAYGQALANDDDDTLLLRTTRALEACETDGCAHDAIATTPFARAFEGSLSTFGARWWTERATFVRSAMEVVRGEMSPEADALLDRIAVDLAVQLPRERTVVLVSDAPPAGRSALVPAVLGARGTCFRRASSERAGHARILDCVFVQALSGLRKESQLGRSLEERAWQLLVIHAVAATLTAWAPDHLSPTRRSAMTVEPELAAWLAEHWRARAEGEAPDVFARRYSQAWHTMAHGGAHQ